MKVWMMRVRKRKMKMTIAKNHGLVGAVDKNFKFAMI